VHNINGYALDTSDNVFPTGFYWGVSDYFQVYYNNTSHNIMVKQHGYSSKPLYITIQYTKTTD